MAVRIFVGKKQFQEVYPHKLARRHSLIETYEMAIDLLLTGEFPTDRQTHIKLYNIRSKGWETYELNGIDHWEVHLVSQIDIKNKHIVIVLAVA